MTLISRVIDTVSPDNTELVSTQTVDDRNQTTTSGAQDGRRQRKQEQKLAQHDLVQSHRTKIMEEEEDVEGRPPYLHAMLAGGIGGTTGDMLMHSLDTVKTRQQGDPHVPPRYLSMSSTYSTIFKQEGIVRGLYSGVTPALMGSFPGTVIFFGTYEWSKRQMIDYGILPSVAYFGAGLLADFAASIVYVPSEVLKTRLQLQGRHNNPFFTSGYNYRSTWDAARTIVRTEGIRALFYGYKATLARDLPFSALQFAFYEEEQKLAKKWCGGREIGLGLEILTAATAGGMAGTLTCPLDVVKTRLQTQINPTSAKTASPSYNCSSNTGTTRPIISQSTATSPVSSASSQRIRHISTSSPSTSTVKPGAVMLDTSSIIQGLRIMYKTEGIAGWFRGVGPRFVWTSVQSGTMLVCYQALLRKFGQWDLSGEGEAIA